MTITSDDPKKLELHNNFYSPILSNVFPFHPSALNKPHKKTSKAIAFASSYGTHYTQYGGIGEGNVGGYYPLRHHRHLRSGIDEEPKTAINEVQRNLEVKRNVGMYAHPVIQFGTDVFNLHQPCEKHEYRLKEGKKLFPRSFRFEREFRDKVMQELFEKERHNIEARLKKRRISTSDKKRLKETVSKSPKVCRKALHSEEVTECEMEKFPTEPKAFDYGTSRSKEFMLVGLPFRTKLVQWKKQQMTLQK